jgi:hypothetical protein
MGDYWISNVVHLNPGEPGETNGRAVAERPRRKSRKKMSDKVKRELEELHQERPDLWKAQEGLKKPSPGNGQETFKLGEEELFALLSKEDNKPGKHRQQPTGTPQGTAIASARSNPRSLPGEEGIPGHDCETETQEASGTLHVIPPFLNIEDEGEAKAQRQKRLLEFHQTASAESVPLWLKGSPREVAENAQEVARQSLPDESAVGRGAGRGAGTVALGGSEGENDREDVDDTEWEAILSNPLPRHLLQQSIRIPEPPWREEISGSDRETGTATCAVEISGTSTTTPPPCQFWKALRAASYQASSQHSGLS